jgi:hypothetical protein
MAQPVANNKKRFWQFLVTLLFLVFAVGILVSRGQQQEKGLCFSLEQTAKEACWREQILGTLSRKGVAAAFDVLAVFFEEDPSFASPCHDFTHRIGRAAYEQFVEGKPFEVTDKTAYCSFGFYHGFMESLISRGGSIAEAQQFCTYIDEELREKVPGIRFSCYHGIGHGSVDIHNTTFWGDEKSLIHEPLLLCEQFARSQEQLKLCATGVFDSISAGYYNQQNGLEMNKEDPLWLCKIQPDKYREACYLDMMPAMLWFFSYDIPKAIVGVMDMAEPAHRKAALEQLVSGSVRHVRDQAGLEQSIEACRRLTSDLRTLCIASLGSGLMQFGPPEKEYVEALEFCAGSALAEDEKDACFAFVLSYVFGRYPKEKSQTICAAVDAQYQKYCHE